MFAVINIQIHVHVGTGTGKKHFYMWTCQSSHISIFFVTDAANCWFALSPAHSPVCERQLFLCFCILSPAHSAMGLLVFSSLMCNNKI